MITSVVGEFFFNIIQHVFVKETLQKLKIAKITSTSQRHAYQNYNNISPLIIPNGHHIYIHTTEDVPVRPVVKTPGSLYRSPRFDHGNGHGIRFRTQQLRFVVTK